MPLSNRIVLTQSLLAIAEQAWSADPDRLFVDLPLKEQLPHLTKLDLARFTLYVEREIGVDVSDGRWHLNETLHQWATRLREALDNKNALPFPPLFSVSDEKTPSQQKSYR